MASISIDNVYDIGISTATIDFSVSGLSMSTSVYRIYVYAVEGSTETYIGRTSSFAGPSFSGSYDLEDLKSSTSYKFRIKLYNTSGEYLDLTYTTVNTYRTDDAPAVSSVYYARVVLYGNGGRTSSGAQYINFDGWSGASWDDYADIEIDFDGSDFLRSGYRLDGFSTSSSATSARYDVEDSIVVTAISTDPDDPTIRTLYAVWIEEVERPPNWSWVSTVSTGAEVRSAQQADGTYYAYYLTASEWLAFIERIQEFADYLEESLSSTRISQATAGVVAGYGMTAAQANGAQLLIASLSPPKSPPSAVAEGDMITAAFINGLKDSLNSIQ